MFVLKCQRSVKVIMNHNLVRILLILDRILLLIREKGITTLRIYQYGIFHHTVIETCFEMQNTRNYNVIQIINPPIFKIVLKLDQKIHNLILLLNFRNIRP